MRCSHSSALKCRARRSRSSTVVSQANTISVAWEAASSIW
jgi:hypothetical protein